MDDGKAAGPKLKWWSRPGRTPGTQPSAEAGPQAVPSAAGPADAVRADASGASGGAGPSDAQDSGDWIVRPPEQRNGSEAGMATASAGGAKASDGPDAAVVPDATDVPEAAEVGEVAGADDAPAVDAGAGTVLLGSAAAPPVASMSAETPSAPPQRQQPLHAEDPYGTPPYGGPGPWAPAPPVELPEHRTGAMSWPGGTPAHGTVLPPAAGPMPPYGAPAPGAGYPSPPPPPHPTSPHPTPQGTNGSGIAVPPAQPGVALAAPGDDRAPVAPGADRPHPTGPIEAMRPGTAEAAHLAPAAVPNGSPQQGLQKAGAGQPLAAGSGPSPDTAPQPARTTGPDPTAAPVPDTADTAFLPHPGDGGPRPAAPAPGPYAGQPQPQPQPQPQSVMAGGHGPDGAPAPAPHGAWQQYDPWRAPLQGGPGVPPPGTRRNRRGMLAAGAVALALLAGGVGGGIGAYVERYGGINDIKLPQAAGDDGGRKPDSVAGIAQSALPGVVTIHVRGNAEQGTGTGFVLDRQGHILTNNHVVTPAGTGGEISVTFSGGQTAKAKVVGQDGGYDLAVVQVEGVTGLRPLTLGNSDSVQVGDPVVAIGAPYDLANTVTSGIISAKQRPITAGGQKGDGSDVSYVDALQTDAPINPGNSGGPLVDAKARVIGINSAIRAADSGSGLDGGGQGSQGGSIGLGFAIPINQAKRVAEELINTGRATHPVIGVTLEMEYAGDGARVSEHSKDGKQPVTRGGPAAKAGIRAGDVITKVDGSPVHSGEELIVKIRSHRPGDTLMLTLQRNGKERALRLRLGSSSSG